jgi:hypothetical protein
MSDEAGQLGPSYDATVMIDIGGDVGALIIMTDASMHLAEIEVSPAGDEAAAAPHVHEHDGHAHTHAHPNRTHVAVRERRGPSGVRYAAIYPELVEGEYSVWDVDGTTVHTTTRIVGGQITELDW